MDIEKWIELSYTGVVLGEFLVIHRKRPILTHKLTYAYTERDLFIHRKRQIRKQIDLLTHKRDHKKEMLGVYLKKCEICIFVSNPKIRLADFFLI